MLCYRCGSHVPDTSESCATCGQKLSGGGLRQATGTFSRRRLSGSGVFDGAPYKAGDVIFGRYEVRDCIGQGPVGFVFRAKDKQVDVDVAVKVIQARLVQTAEERSTFSKAIRLGRRLNHPNVVRTYEEGSDRDNPYFTLQHLEGLTLRKIIDLRLAKGQLFAVKELEPIIGQIAFALDAVHTVGPHADLKPENVIVLPDLLKLADVQLSLAIPRVPFVQAVKLRKADHYLAPEYVSGQSVDQRADLYSLGVILGEMVAGVTPEGGVIPELTRVVPDLPQQIEGLYRRALNPNPTARYKNPGEIHEELLRLLGRSTLPPPLKPRANTQANLVVRATAPPQPAGSEDERPPPDATQPMSSSELPLVLGDPSAGQVREETQLILSYEDNIPYDPTDPPRGPNAASAQQPVPPTVLVHRAPLSTRSLVLLAALSLVGLLAGSLGGYWAVQRIRQKQAESLPLPPDGDSAKRSDARKQPDLATTTPTTSKSDDARLPGQPAPSGTSSTPPDAGQPSPLVAPPTAKKPEDLAKKDAGASAEAPKASKPEAPLVLAKAEPPAAKPPSALTEEGCPEGMKKIESGSFRMGTAKDDPMMGFDERTTSTVQVNAFCVDLYEYPNRRGATPTANVTWADAKRMCEAKKRRLCAEEEWEKACKGPGSSRFPYGNTYDADSCNTEDATGEDRALASSGKFQRCRSGYGVVDLSGNLSEWTSTHYAANADRTQKGGAFDKPDYASRCSARKNGAPGAKSAEVGFRCCADVPAAD
ncbi:MAG: protein kinase domain-containing protein [Myxococcaceae bacterium]